MLYCDHHAEAWNHRTIEWLGLEGNPKTIQFQTCATGSRYLPLDQVAPSLSNLAFDTFPWMGSPELHCLTTLGEKDFFLIAILNFFLISILNFFLVSNLRLWSKWTPCAMHPAQVLLPLSQTSQAVVIVWRLFGFFLRVSQQDIAIN